MFVISYAAAFLSILLVVGAVAFSISKNNRVLARTLALYCFTAALWIGGNAAADVSYTIPALLLTSTIAYIGGALNLFLFLLLVDLLIEQRFPPTWKLALYGIPVAGMVFFAFTPYAISDTHFPPGSPAQITPGPLYLITFFILITALLYAVIRLTSRLSREPGDTRRIELSYILLGVMLSLLGEIIFDIMLPLLGELRFYTLGPITSIFFIASAAYVIGRRRHFDIRLTLQRGMVSSALLALIFAFYATLLSVLLYLLPLNSTTAVYVSAGCTVVIGIMGVPLISRYFTRLTDPIFFRDTFDSAEALRTLSEILYRHDDLSSLVEAAERELTSILRAEWVGITYATAGIDYPDFDAADAGRVFAVPIMAGDRYVGSIHVGRKRSGGDYTERDRMLLETFAFQAATAFSRADLYEKTRQHAAELEQTVAKRTKELRDIQEQERQMLVELSHNLQTPLAIFQARLDQLKHSRLTSDDARSLEQSVKRLSGFIYDLLALAKLESEKPVANEPVNLSLLLEELVEELRVIAGDRRIRIESTIEPNILVRGDEKRLREAVLNIASNALKYMREDGPRLITCTLSGSGSVAELAITDTGHGIAAADIPHVFERFYRRSDTIDLPGGNGLGLAITKRIVERHHGDIHLESTEGEGTQVSLSFPIQS